MLLFSQLLQRFPSILGSVVRMIFYPEGSSLQSKAKILVVCERALIRHPEYVLILCFRLLSLYLLSLPFSPMIKCDNQ